MCRVPRMGLYAYHASCTSESTASWSLVFREAYMTSAQLICLGKVLCYKKNVFLPKLHLEDFDLKSGVHLLMPRPADPEQNSALGIIDMKFQTLNGAGLLTYIWLIFCMLKWLHLLFGMVICPGTWLFRWSPVWLMFMLMPNTKGRAWATSCMFFVIYASLDVFFGGFFLESCESCVFFVFWIQPVCCTSFNWDI